MGKPKIEEITSKEYKKRRIDRFFIKGNQDIHQQIISFLNGIGFSKKCLKELDFSTYNAEGYFFVFDKDMNFHMILSQEGANLILDTKKPKKILISELEKYFELF